MCRVLDNIVLYFTNRKLYVYVIYLSNNLVCSLGFHGYVNLTLQKKKDLADGEGGVVENKSEQIGIHSMDSAPVLCRRPFPIGYAMIFLTF